MTYVNIFFGFLILQNPNQKKMDSPSSSTSTILYAPTSPAYSPTSPTSSPTSLPSSLVPSLPFMALPFPALEFEIPGPYEFRKKNTVEYGSAFLHRKIKLHEFEGFFPPVMVGPKVLRRSERIRAQRYSPF